ncbi:S8 family serine peptidase [Stakelama sp. CBK3Z-3]|uniref:S8 family serine peptidase n=2 Tax=Stakelama flava TaxID=2860338 RepID=A0ABS6XIH7_9SPHN|nr:S8 family serine peptidase [Stakelama flava]
MNALAAYQAGATGSGVIAGVIDTGIDTDSAQFGNRVLSASLNVAGGSTIEDEDGHGTAVAFTLAGGRDGQTLPGQGVAFDASLLVVRADTPASCAAESDDDGGDCSFLDSNIAKGLDAARAAGARVVNLSLGGDAPGARMKQAIADATAAGIILVMSAGNDGEANPNGFTDPALDPSLSNGLIIIAGSVNSSDTISSFSNRAGASAAHYLTAVGEGVLAPGLDGTTYRWAGTSFSAPQISGAIALLAQAFPNLTGKQIVDLLFRTARDAGESGVDSVYGNGVLDLTEAFQPQGTMSVAGTDAVASMDVNATLSAPMGDAATGALETVALDRYDRAYTLDLAGTIRNSGPQTMLAAALGAGRRTLGVDAGATGIAVTIAPGMSNSGYEPLGLAQSDMRAARGIAASVSTQLGKHLSFAIATSQSGTALAAGLAGQAQPAFLIADDPTRVAGFAADIDAAAAIRQVFGEWGVTAAAERGSALDRANEAIEAARGRWDRYDYNRTTLAIDRAVGPVRASAAITRLDESDTVLGAHFEGSLGGASATSWFADLSARADLGEGWSAGASMRRGWTRAHLNAAIAGDGTIRTSGFAVDIGRRDAWTRGDRIALRLSQPLRVSSGGIDLTLPANWDYDSESVDAFRTQRLNLAPRGREVNAELGYTRPWIGGTVSSNFFYRRDPGNIATLPDDYGMALRFSVDF